MVEMAHGNNALLQFHLWAGYIIMLPLALTLGVFITLPVRLWSGARCVPIHACRWLGEPLRVLSQDVG